MSLSFHPDPPSPPLRLDALASYHAGKTEILPEGVHESQEHYNSVLLSQRSVAPVTELQARMDVLARSQEHSRLASTVAHLEADLQRERREHSRVVAAAAEREHEIDRRVQEAVGEQVQRAQQRVWQLEQRLADANSDRHQVLAERTAAAAEAARLREELHRCKQQRAEAKAAEEAALHAARQAAATHSLKERSLTARCEQLQGEVAAATTAASSAAAAREQERNAAALERVMRAASKQEEAWAERLKEALGRTSSAEEEASQLRQRVRALERDRSQVEAALVEARGTRQVLHSSLDANRNPNPNLSPSPIRTLTRTVICTLTLPPPNPTPNPSPCHPEPQPHVPRPSGTPLLDAMCTSPVHAHDMRPPSRARHYGLPIRRPLAVRTSSCAEAEHWPRCADSLLAFHRAQATSAGLVRHAS